MSDRRETVREVFNKLLKYPLDYDGMSGECVIPKYKVERYIARALAAYEREMAAKDAAHQQWRENYHSQIAEKDAEIARLKAALKPVMECNYVWKSKEEDIYAYISRVQCVIDKAQRIILEAWDDKNYFWKSASDAKGDR